MSGFSSYAEYDALGLAEQVRLGRVTPSELVEEAIGRIERVNPELNAVAARDYERAREVARGPLPDGPFRGVPFVLKDLVARVEGLRMTHGTRLCESYVPDYDSEITRRYRAAGLVFVAKTTTSELGLTPVTEPPIFGPTSTPWKKGRSSGGSSGGSAALVAAGAVPMGHGGDGGGSLRMPASCCGVFGFKPTRGRTPAGPDVGEHWHGLGVEHAITRSVRDSAALLDVTSAPDPGAPYHAPARARLFLVATAKPPRRLRIAFTAKPFLPSHVQPDAVAAIEDAAELCQELGHAVEEAAPTLNSVQFAKDLMTVVAAETAAEIPRLEHLAKRRRRRDDMEVGTRLVELLGHSTSAADLCLAVRRLHGIGRDLASFFSTYDILLTPTLAAAPPEHFALRPKGVEGLLQRALAGAGLGAPLKLPGLLDALVGKVFDFTPFTALANAAGVPSMSVPLFWNTDELPIGVTFTGRFGDDDTLFALGAELETARPWRARRPPIHCFD